MQQRILKHLQETGLAIKYASMTDGTREKRKYSIIVDLLHN